MVQIINFQVLAIATLHIILCPFTKVEESFNIQAIHDILYYRHNLSQYDHNEFPGVVPRSFIGPLAISAISAPIVLLLQLFGLYKFWSQYVVRFVLALTVVAAWSRLRNTLQKQFGSTFTWWYTLITLTQFHFMFYMSRTLPNIMVMPLAFDGWLSGKQTQFIVSAGAAIIIFRAELAMLFGLFLIIDLYFKKIDIKMLLKIAIPVGLGLVALNVLVDSIFWGRLIWPEAVVFWYNTVLNKSSDWGTSPFLWYLYSALPRGLGASMLLIPLGLYYERRLIPAVAPAYTYILLYSLLPHKELRFIIYVFPLLNMASAAAASYVYVRRSKTPMYEILFMGMLVLIVINVGMTFAFTYVAMSNYPGGDAITKFHKVVKDEPYVHVHISNLAAQTGVTRFTQLHDHWVYNKTENLDTEQLMDFTHLIIEAKSRYSPAVKAFHQTHTILDHAETFSQVAGIYKPLPMLRIKTKPALFILEKKFFRQTKPIGHDDLLTAEIEFSEDALGITEYTHEFDAVDLEEEDIQVEENIVEDETVSKDDVEEIVPIEPSVRVVTDKDDANSETEEDLQQPIKAKKAFDEIKLLRKEKKKKAMEKIKSETRKKVVASAKEKLKEIMKRHKHIAEELTDKGIDSGVDQDEKDGRGDIPESDVSPRDFIEENNIPLEQTEGDKLETIAKESATSEAIEPTMKETRLHTNESIDSIVEEVIARLLDRKIYDDKTKPEDIKAEDRQVIQSIVEEVLAERMNYTTLEI